MKESYGKPIKLKKNIKNIPPSLIKIFETKEDFYNNLYFKKILKSLKQEQNQKMNLTERNDSYKIENKINNIKNNFNDKKYNKEYQNNMNINNSMILIKRNKNKNNYISHKNKMINNSYSTINIYDRTIINDNQPKLSHFIVKPYIKKTMKTIIINSNPNNKSKKKIKNNQIKLDLTNPETIDNIASFTDRNFYKNKYSTHNKDYNDNINDINLKYTFRNKKYEKKENKFKYNGDLISKLENDEEYYNKINSYKPNPKLLEKKIGKKNITKTFLTQDNIIDLKYKRRLTQAMILLLENYYKTYLFKIKYIFLNNLKKYINTKTNKIFKIYRRNRNKEIRFINNNPKTEIRKEINYESKYENNPFLNKYISRKEKILMYKLRNASSDYTPNPTELCRNWSELIKMKEIINRRKKTQSKSKSKNKEKEKEKDKDKEKDKEKNIIVNTKKIIYRNNNINKNNFIIYKKRKQNNKIKNNDYSFQENDGNNSNILIIKKIISKDKKIYIDIKYLEYMNFKNKTKFKNLKISKDFSIDLIRQASKKRIIIQRLGNNFFNKKIVKKNELNDNKTLGVIKEVYNRPNNADKLYS